MYIGEQLNALTDDRLKLSRQLGCENVVIDLRPNTEVTDETGLWDVTKVRAQIERCVAQGLNVDVMALDVGSLLLDSIYAPEKAAANLVNLQANIRVAGEVGLTCLKYNVQMVGITRTGLVEGRGGVQCSSFRAADYSPENDEAFSYWGVGHPGALQEGADIPLDAMGKPARVGQVVAKDTAGVSEQQGWDALKYLVEGLIPVAEEAGVRMAAHPHDPAYPIGGLNGVHHNLGSIEGIRRFLDIANGSAVHGLNFCQGTVAEMSEEPTSYVLRAIREFGPEGKIFMVHFRNIAGGYLDFHECFPDDGAVDMAACVRAYHEVGYDGILCPDHVPISELDPDRSRFFSFSLGYTKGLLDASRAVEH